MSVKINWKGRLGNHAFQYFSAYIYCKKHNLKLLTKPSKNLLGLFEINENNNEINEDEQCFLDNKVLNFKDYDNDNEIIYYGNKNYIFNDYFQNAEYINNNSIYLLNNIKPIQYTCKLNYQIKENDILCILRMGDFLHSGSNSEIVHPDYFLNILKKNQYNKIYFLIWPFKSPTDDCNLKKYLEFFKEYDTVVINENRNEFFDFHITNHFENIAFTNSTFNWWSAFFTKDIEKKSIYTPKYFGFFGIGKHFRCHGSHIKNLWNIHNISIPIENKFINLKEQ